VGQGRRDVRTGRGEGSVLDALLKETKFLVEGDLFSRRVLRHTKAKGDDEVPSTGAAVTR
jgi:hypothetical protein